ncbi:MAG TPA: TetR/AcrR family transcriptional regulator [Anaerolineales bacterium]|nr:TetR/AcrR family transcriptional regulator [Anaerolineales bacterium]
MVRTIKKEEYATKRNEILDVAFRLVYSKGYDKMTIQDILDQLQISKGAFYHYFESKADVLEALVERMAAEQVESHIMTIVQNPDLTAIEKLQLYFDTAVQWKTTQKEFIMQLTRVWYSDENALARQKMFNMMVTHVTPLFVEIIKQGAKEGVFSTPYPEYASQVNINLIQGLGDTFARMLLSEESKNSNTLQEAKDLIAAYNDALERILGAPKGSIHLMDIESLREWFSQEDTTH